MFVNIRSCCLQFVSAGSVSQWCFNEHRNCVKQSFLPKSGIAEYVIVRIKRYTRRSRLGYSPRNTNCQITEVDEHMCSAAPRHARWLEAVSAQCNPRVAYNRQALKQPIYKRYMTRERAHTAQMGLVGHNDAASRPVAGRKTKDRPNIYIILYICNDFLCSTLFIYSHISELFAHSSSGSSCQLMV